MTGTWGGRPVARRQPVPVLARDWVKPDVSAGTLPLMVRPMADVDLATWASANAPTVDAWLTEHGAVLFSGFGTGLDSLPAVAAALAGPPAPYQERSSPRTEVAPGVYTSTDHPADQRIPLHNENSYQHRFPSRLVFCCLTAPGWGGATPLADCRRVLARIDPAVVSAFRAGGVRYVRNYAAGLGLPWQEAFQETDRGRVEAYCAENDLTAAWQPGGGLRTEAIRPAVGVHPASGAETWFNHAAFFHVTSVAPQVAAAMREQLGEAGLPSNTYYGDGAPIGAEALAAIRGAYAAQTALVSWRQGDVLLIDNLLVAHGREPFGGSRRVVVSLAGSLSHRALPGPRRDVA